MYKLDGYLPANTTIILYKRHFHNFHVVFCHKWLYYYHRWQESEQILKKETAIRTGGFNVSTPKKDLLISFDEIEGFYIDGDYCVVVTIERKKYFVDNSLDKVEKNRWRAQTEIAGSDFKRLMSGFSYQL